MFKQIRLLPDHYLGVTFTYSPDLVQKIKRLEQRRWNPDAKRWEIHLSHLPELIEILAMSERNLPRDVREAYTEAGWENVAVRIEIGNVQCSIGGRNLPLDALDEATSFRVPGAEFAPNYKSGDWDGRRHLLRRGAEISFPSGLLSRVRGVIAGASIEYAEVDSRTPPPPELPLRFDGPELRDYQAEAVLAAKAAGRGILQMATGAGKTMVAARIIADLSCRAMFFVHTRDLLQQAHGVFEETLGCEVGRIGDGRADIRPVTVAMIQTSARALGIALGDEGEDALPDDAPLPVQRYAEIAAAITSAPLVFFDECHHVPAETFYRVSMGLSGAYYRFGLSATPYRSDNMDLLLEAALGDKLYQVNSSALIERGYLVPPHIRFVAVPVPEEGAGGMSYADIYLRFVVEHERRNAIVAEEAHAAVRDGKSVLVLVQQIRHGEQLAALLPEAILLTGQVDSEKRKSVLDGLRERRVGIVIATTLADEGLDIPSLDVLILAGGGKSETRALQRVGRALRQTETKREATVVDFADPVKYLCEHSRRRLAIYRTEPRFEIEFDETHAPLSAEMREEIRPGLFERAP